MYSFVEQLTHVNSFNFQLSGYSTIGEWEPYPKDSQRYFVHHFQGLHQNEYVVYDKEKGKMQLFDRGILQMIWSCNEEEK